MIYTYIYIVYVLSIYSLFEIEGSKNKLKVRVNICNIFLYDIKDIMIFIVLFVIDIWKVKLKLFVHCLFENGDFNLINLILFIFFPR